MILEIYVILHSFLVGMAVRENKQHDETLGIGRYGSAGARFADNLFNYYLIKLGMKFRFL